MFRVLLVTCILGLAVGCRHEPSCAAGALGAEWQRPPLEGLVPTHTSTLRVCAIPAADRATHASFWLDDTVNNAKLNYASIAEGRGFVASGNWAGSGALVSRDFTSDRGGLRLEIHEANGGVLIAYTFTPRVGD